MALVVKDRVQETTTTSGTGTLTLLGAVPGFQSFSSSIGNGNTTFYTIYDNVAQVWEVGVGTVGAGTLARTTVLSNSSGTTSPITLAGNTASVFVTYPAEKSINYDANDVATIGDVLSYSDTGIVGSFASTVAGYNQVVVQNKSSATNASSNFNVSNDAGTAGSNYAELGINSSTFTGTGSFNIAGASYLASASTDLTIGTYGAYNVHFVTNSSTTDAMTIFNSGGVSLGGYADPGIGTLYANNVYLGFTTITAAAGTTVLTNASSAWQQVVGTTTQTIRLPNATTLYKGLAFTISNNSTGAVTITDNASTTLDTTVTGGSSVLVLTDNSTSAGTWRAYSYLPSSYDFSTATADFGGATITNATWNGNTIGTAYGGTGLTTFAGANNAIYSTSSSALAAGTLPVAAGGTGATTLTGYVYGNGTGAFTASTTIPFSSVTGTVPTTQGGTALTSYTTGDVIYASATNTLAKLGIGSTGQVLTVSGGIPAWSTPSSSVSTFQTSLSGLTPSTATSGAVTLAGTLGPTSGGTGLTTYTQGDLVYASGTNTLGKLADVATGNALISGGVSADPSWGKIGLTTHVSGTLPVANGGTNITTYTTGDILYASATNTLSKLPAGTNGQILTLASGVPSWAASTSSGASFVVTDFTATAGQTTFTVTYTVGLVEVYRNGVKLAIADYTASNGTTIVLATGANAGDVIEVVAFGAANTAAAISYDTFSGTGSQTAFIMSVTPANSQSVVVAISGVVQDPGNYTVSGVTLTFSTAPPLGTNNISCRYLGLPTTTTGTGAVINATNGIIINSQTITASYTIPVGSNAMSTGPVTAASGVTVTVSAGSRYIVI